VNLSPQELGLPFSVWKEGQFEAIVAAAASDKKVIMLDAPPGSGKSGIAVGLANILGVERTNIVVHTKQYQEQYLEALHTAGLKSIRGRANFRCDLDPLLRADEAPCTISSKKLCSEYQAHNCKYYVQKEEALAARISVWNYANFLIESNRPREEKFFCDLLVLDECHLTESELKRHVEIIVSERTLDRLDVDSPSARDYKAWKAWALYHEPNLTERFGKGLTRSEWSSLPPDELRLYMSGRRLLESVRELARAMDSDWLIEEEKGRTTFRPIWVSRYGPKYLFSHAPKVVLMSGTILTPEHMADGLGIPESDIAYFRLPYSFPPANRPVIVRPVVKVRHGMDDSEKRVLVRAVDKILATHPDEKGLVHTTNYALAELLMKESQFRHRLITHRQDDRGEVLGRFKYAPGNWVLVSPSMVEGVDLPDSASRFQVLMKLPFPNLADAQIKQRMKLGPDGLPNKKGNAWYQWITLCKLIQACFRSVRHNNDRAHTYILDKQSEWFLRAVWKIIPPGFRVAIRQESGNDAIVDQILEDLKSDLSLADL
jgi:ATP-dependent DNA helicase DinG